MSNHSQCRACHYGHPLECEATEICSKEKEMSKLVFLGGTCGNNSWRDHVTNELVKRGIKSEHIFNPVVKDWNEEAQKREEAAKANADVLLFYLASPQQDGNPLSAYSMVEATMSLYTKPSRTVIIFDNIDIAGHALKSVKQTEKVLKAAGFSDSIYSDISAGLDRIVAVLDGTNEIRCSLMKEVERIKAERGGVFDPMSHLPYSPRFNRQKLDDVKYKDLTLAQLKVFYRSITEGVERANAFV